MSIEQSPNNHSPQTADDAFWVALFSHEEVEKTTPASTHVEIPWQNIQRHANNSTHQVEETENQKDPWQVAQDLFSADELIELEVAGHNKGGLLVKWYGLQGFIPASQLIDFPHFHLESERISALKQWHQKNLKVKIIEVNPKQNRLIFSERAALVKANDRKRLLDEITVGEHVRGEVTNLTNFGAFVDLGGVEGLIHISELSWSRVTHPSDIVKPGQDVTTRVLNVDPDNGRIALSLKRLKEDPWQTVNERFKPGQTVAGVISKVVSFGAFVQIEDELEGLIHISELAEGTFLHPRNVVSCGQRIQARVLHVDGAEKRLALSLRGISG